MPEINIKANHVRKINMVCPISGCDANNAIIGRINNKLVKYFIY